MNKALLLLIPLMVCPDTYAFETTLWVAGGTARVEGFVQTPKGGSANTTSFQRPNYKEVEIKRAPLLDAGINVKHQSYSMSLDYRRFPLDNTRILQNDLTTHARFIPQQTLFTLDAAYQLWTFSVGKQFSLTRRFLFSPIVQGNWLNFQYHFSTPLISSTRSYNPLAVDLGAEMRYYFNHAISGDLCASISLPLANLRITRLETRLVYTATHNPRFNILPQITLGYVGICYADHQAIPNHLQMFAKPYVLIGALLRIEPA